MTLFHLLLVAVIQGVTEFLPVSSSGHLILLPNLTGLDDQGQLIDVAVHVGTLGAVSLYFRHDLVRVVVGLSRIARRRTQSEEARLALHLIVASVPVVLLGLFMKLTGLDQALRSVAVIGWTMLLFGIVLYWTDRTGPVEKTASDWTMRGAITMGLWQALALIPGTSRSGITISAARYLGFQRSDAARLAMLMSVPTILASGMMLGAEAAFRADTAALRDAAIAAAFSFGAALIALVAMMRLLRVVSYTPYVVYRVILGLFLLGIAYS